MRTRWVKVLRDLRAGLARNTLLAMAIALGVLSVGTILGAYSVLTREMARNYLGTEPAEMTLKVDGELTPAIVDAVADLNEVAVAERHATLIGRMRIDGDWRPMLFFVIDDFNDIRTNRFTRLSGAWPPPAGTILIERTARVTMKADEGDEVTVRTPAGHAQRVTISGIVHDPSLAPAWQEQMGYGYMTRETLVLLGESQGFDELRIRLNLEKPSTEEIESAAGRITSFLSTKGVTVDEAQIPPPRTHPHQNQMTTILSLFLVFAYATLFLSAILVATSLATLMARQLREIGVMKAVGARSRQVATMYLATQAVIASAATVVAVPLSQHTAGLMIEKISTLLNLQIVDTSIPLRVTITQVLSGICIPLLIALVPVWRARRITVREALDSHGASATERVGRFVARFKFFGTTGALAVRNVFRQRARLAMAVALLAAGGALFMTAMNVADAWEANLEKIYRYRHYDVEIRLNRSIDAESARTAIEKLPGVTRVESWQYFPAAFTKDVPYDLVHVYPDKGHGSFAVLGAPSDTRIVDFPVLDGRWLSSATQNEIVLNHSARGRTPGLKVGDTVRLNIDHHPTEWTLVGFVEDLGSTGATAYVPASALVEMTREPRSSTNMLRIALQDRGPASVSRATRNIEASLGENASIAITLPMSLIRSAIGEHMGVLVTSLLALSILMAIVGGFGLAATTGMSVLERTREIGVMRAIGATPALTGRLLIAEGFVIAVISGVIALIASAALSYFMGRLLGTMSFQTPLPLTISSSGLTFWALLLFGGSAASTYLPARKSSSMTVSNALAYA